MKNQTNWSIAGGVMAAIGASVCCVGPLLLLSIGVSGAWIANLTALEAYRPIFITAVIIAFAFAGWKLFRTEQKCDPSTACAVPVVRQRRQIVFMIAASIALLLITSPYWILIIIS